MSYEGDIRLGDTIDLKFTTRSFTTGVPTTLAGTPVISAYPGNSTTQLTAGITLTVDFDAVTGLHNVRVVATSGNGYATATNYTLVITTGTVGGVSVVGEVVGSFSIENRSALMPVTAARTLVVDAAGLADANAVKLGPTGAGTALTARDIGASVLLSTGAGAGQLDFTAGVVKANATQWLGTAISAPNVAGTPIVDVTRWLGTTAQAPAVAGVPAVDIARIRGGLVPVPTVTGVMGVDVAYLKSIAAFGSGGAFNAMASGTADSGSTTTMVDAARTEGTVDAWKGCYLLLTSGAVSPQIRLITAFDPATDTITFAPALSGSGITTEDYVILPEAGVDVRLWQGTTLFGNQGGVLNSIASGTADSGSTTTMVDAARTEGTVDAWKGCYLLLTSGAISPQIRLITAFDPTTDTITFAPALSGSGITTENYVILPGAGVDIRLWAGSTPSALIAGRVDSNIQAAAAGVITATVAPNLDAAVSTRATQAQILSDATPFAGASIAAVKTKTDLIKQAVQKNTSFAGFHVFMTNTANEGVEGLAVSGFRLRTGDTLFAALDNPVTELDAGLYKVDLTANDLNGNEVTLGFTATGAVTREITLTLKP